MGLPKLGFGTIWIGGRRWPVNNASYVRPGREEVTRALDTVARAGIRMIDTAHGYCDAEFELKEYFKANPGFAASSFITTKLGEWVNPDTYESVAQCSERDLYRSVMMSLHYLGRIDVLYFHKPLDQDVLANAGIRETIEWMLLNGFIMNCGLSASKAEVLETLMSRGLIWPYFVQTSYDVYSDRYDLIERLYDMGKKIVINGPSRLRKEETPEAIFKKLMANPKVHFVLTGTRHHLDENIGYCQET